MITRTKDNIGHENIMLFKKKWPRYTPGSYDNWADIMMRNSE